MTENITSYLNFINEAQGKYWKLDTLTPTEFVLKYGRSFPFSANSFKGRRMREKDCYRNAAIKALEYGGLTYVEGYVELFIPIEHAWLVDTAGRVIDPTLRESGSITGYFGVPIKTRYLADTLIRNKVYGVFGYWNYDQLLNDNVDEIVAKLPGENRD